MATPVDFLHAHVRHWKDAEVLFNRDRIANAGQLYGFSAECGLKAILEAFGHRVARKHVAEFWPVFKRLIKERRSAVLLRHIPSGSPFADWSHHERYAPSGHVRKSAVCQHRTGALGVRRMVVRAQGLGVL